MSDPSVAELRQERKNVRRQIARAMMGQRMLKLEGQDEDRSRRLEKLIENLFVGLSLEEAKKIAEAPEPEIPIQDLFNQWLALDDRIRELETPEK